MQLYPGWSARDNYATHNKKALKKRKRDGPGPVQPGSMMSMHHGPPGSIPPPGITSLPNPGIIQDGQYLYDGETIFITLVILIPIVQINSRACAVCSTIRRRSPVS